MPHILMGSGSGRHPSAPMKTLSNRFVGSPRLAFGLQQADPISHCLRPSSTVTAVCSTEPPPTLPMRRTSSSRHPLAHVATKVGGAVDPEREVPTSTGYGRRRLVLPPVSPTRRNDAARAAAVDHFIEAEPARHRLTSGIVAGALPKTKCPTRCLRGDLQPLSDRGTDDLMSTLHRANTVDQSRSSGRPVGPIALMNCRPIIAGQPETAPPVKPEIRLSVHSKRCQTARGRSNAPQPKAQKRWGRFYCKMGPVCRADGTGIPRCACHARRDCRGGPRR